MSTGAILIGVNILNAYRLASEVGVKGMFIPMEVVQGNKTGVTEFGGVSGEVLHRICL